MTKTLEKPEWDNTVLAKGDLVEEIAKLKMQDGEDIIAYIAMEQNSLLEARSRFA